MPDDYSSLKSQQENLISQLNFLNTLIKETSSNLNSFYNSMRWGPNEISTDDYERLYKKGKIYQIEELDILDSLNRISKNLDKLMEDN